MKAPLKCGGFTCGDKLIITKLKLEMGIEFTLE